MKILLILPAGERVRVTYSNPQVPKRAMLRFSVLRLTTVAALTPPRHEVHKLRCKFDHARLDARVTVTEFIGGLALVTLRSDVGGGKRQAAGEAA